MIRENEYIDKLHDKFFHGIATDEEMQELYVYFKDKVYFGEEIHKDRIEDYLLTTHPEYIPNKLGPEYPVY